MSSSFGGSLHHLAGGNNDYLPYLITNNPCTLGISFQTHIPHRL